MSYAYLLYASRPRVTRPTDTSLLLPSRDAQAAATASPTVSRDSSQVGCKCIVLSINASIQCLTRSAMDYPGVSDCMDLLGIRGEVTKTTKTKTRQQVTPACDDIPLSKTIQMCTVR